MLVLFSTLIHVATLVKPKIFGTPILSSSIPCDSQKPQLLPSSVFRSSVCRAAREAPTLMGIWPQCKMWRTGAETLKASGMRGMTMVGRCSRICSVLHKQPVTICHHSEFFICQFQHLEVRQETPSPLKPTLASIEKEKAQRYSYVMQRLGLLKQQPNFLRRVNNQQKTLKQSA